MARVTKAEAQAARWEAHRHEIIDEAQRAMAAAPDAVTVVELALALVDQAAPSLPVGGGLALAGAARPYAEAVIHALVLYPKELRMSDPDPEPGDVPPRAYTLPSLAEQNAAAIAGVEERIAALVDDRLRINAEVLSLRGALVALQAANRHYVKLGAQLALPVGDTHLASPEGPDDATEAES